MKRNVFGMLVFGCLACSVGVEAGEVTHRHAYYHLGGGGVAEVRIDAEAGRILGQRSIFHSPDNPQIEQLVAGEGGGVMAVANRAKDARSIYVLKSGEGVALPEVHRVDLPQRADHLAMAGGQIAVIGHKGAVYRVDPGRPGVVAGSIDLKRELDIQDGSLGAAVFSPGGGRLLVLVGEDSPDGRRRGGRIIVLEWPSLAVAHDIELPRDHPELHHDGEGGRERNPVPVALRLMPGVNTAAIALNLYGAVAFADLDALLEGRLANLAVLPTSGDGKFGAGFPTALFAVEAGGRQLLLADNSGGAGGIAVFDPATRSRLAWLDTGATSMGGFYMVDDTRGVGHRAGVASKRGDSGTETSHSEQNTLVVIDFAPLADGRAPAPRVVEFSDYVYFSTPVGLAGSPPLLFLGFFGLDRKTLSNALYELDAETISDRQPAIGVLRGFY